MYYKLVITETGRNNLKDNPQIFNNIVENRNSLKEVMQHLTELCPLNDLQKNAMFFLNEMIDSLAHSIIADLPEDKNNSWEVN
jgi:hypothetical protein